MSSSITLIVAVYLTAWWMKLVKVPICLVVAEEDFPSSWFSSLFFLHQFVKGKGWGNAQEPAEDIDAHSCCKLQIEDTEIFNEDKTICSELLCAGLKRIEDRLSTTLSSRVITLQSRLWKLSSTRDRSSSFFWRQSPPTEWIDQFICLKVSSFVFPNVLLLVLFVHDVIEVRIFRKTAHIGANALGTHVE